MLVCETPILITLSFLIIGMITDRKLTISGLTLLYFNDKCWVRDYTQYTCFSVTDISLRPCCPDKRGFTVYTLLQSGFMLRARVHKNG